MYQNPMNIAEAIQFYQERRQSVPPAFRALLEGLIAGPNPISFENTSYLDALHISEIALSKTNAEIRVVCGPLCGDFLQAIGKPFEDALDRVCGQHKAKMILLAPAKHDYLKELEYRNLLEISLARANDERAVRHFFVLDTMFARAEEPHGPLQLTSANNSVMAKIYIHDRPRITNLIRMFDTMWAHLKAAHV